MSINIMKCRRCNTFGVMETLLAQDGLCGECEPSPKPTYCRGILINPETREISEFYLEPTLEGMRYALRSMDQHFSGMVERVGLARNEDLWLDEEGCLSPGRAVFSIGGHSFAGAAIILAHDDEGESVKSSLPFDLVRALVSWTNLETTGEFGLGRQYDDPVMGFVIEGGKPIYQERV